MLRGKALYLKRLTSNMRFRSAELGKNISGSTPPSVFIGRFGYPRVAAGPMIPPKYGDTSLMDAPERWAGLQAGNVIDFRLSLVRGKRAVDVRKQDSTTQLLQEIALAKNSFGMEAEFARQPRGSSFSEYVQPFGPSAPLIGMELDTRNIRWDRQLEKAYYDTDLLAAGAVQMLYSKGIHVSALQKALSVGAFGLEENRKLVPTRWSITAVDSMLAARLVEELRRYEIIDDYMLFEHESMNSYFAILFTPTSWRYEMVEAFMRILGKEELVFSDWEIGEKKGYSDIGGCYYSGRLALAEKLCSMRRQAGAIVFRESRPGYVPLGVWLVREVMRTALSKEPVHFPSLEEALDFIADRMRLPFARYKSASALLKQRSLREWAKMNK